MNVSTTITEDRTYNSLFLVSKSVFIEIKRKRDIYVLMILLGVFVLGVLAMSITGIENAATAAFLLNLGMVFSYVSAHILALSYAVRQMPNEKENKTEHNIIKNSPLYRAHESLEKRHVYVLSQALIYFTSSREHLFPGVPVRS